MRLSYSSLETYKQCPLKFKFREIDRIKVPKTKELFFGTLIHDSLRFLHDTSRLVPPTEEEILQHFSQKWESDIYEDKQEEAIAFSQGVKILKNYYSQNYPTNFNIIDLETRFEASILSQDETHIITGIIDRIDRLENGIFEVIDYKTSRKMPGQKIIDENLQLAIYHLGIANRWPSIIQQNRPVKLSLYFLQHGEKLSTLRLPESINKTKEDILNIINQIKKDSLTNNFETNSSPLCAWCQYQQYCPLFKHKFKEKTFSDSEAIAVTHEYFELKEKADEISKRMTEIKSIINRYCDEQKIERVFSDIGSITRASKKTYLYDGSALKNILEPIGKWREVLNVDTTKLKKIIESLPADIKRKIEEIKKIDKETKVITATKNKK